MWWYIEAITDDNQTYVINTNTLELLIINWNYIGKIGKVFFLWDEKYTEVIWKDTYIINNNTFKPFKINWEFIKQIWDKTQFRNNQYIQVETNQRFYLLNENTLEPLQINWEFIKKLWNEVIVWNNTYINIIGNKGWFLLDKITLQPLMIDWDIIEEVWKWVTFLDNNYLKIKTVDNKVYLIDMFTLQKLKFNSIFVSNIVWNQQVWNKEYIKIEDENRKTLYIDNAYHPICDSNGRYVRNIEDLANGYMLFVYDSYKIIVDSNEREMTVNGEKISNFWEWAYGYIDFINITTTSWNQYIYDLNKKEWVICWDWGYLQKVIKTLENGMLLVSTIQSKELVVDKNFQSVWWNWPRITNNLEKEIEYQLWWVRVKNALYSDGTFGLVNTMTLEKVLLQVDNYIIVSIENAHRWLFTVILDNGEEKEIINKDVIQKSL